MVKITLAILLVAFVGLQVWRWLDDRRADQAWRNMARAPDSSPSRFDPSMVDGLPEPARRFFRFVIKPGAALSTVAEIRMGGEIGLGTREEPNYVPMRAHQILAPPQGFVWKPDAGRGAMKVSGSDGFDGEKSWVRFWLIGTVPVARAGGNVDHARSAFGRLVAESVFWAPAALLPQNGVSWEAVTGDTARATVSHEQLTQTVDVTVGDDGRPIKVVVPRWTDYNPDKIYRIQPFGGYLSEFREFEGYMLPTRVEGGNFIGTEDYFPFYKAVVEDIRFVARD